MEIKSEILFGDQPKIAELYNIPVSNVRKLVPNVFHKKSMSFIMKTYNFT